MEEREPNENMLLTDELIQGLDKRIGYLEKDLPVLLQQSLADYQTTLNGIAHELETLAKSYDAGKMEGWSGKLESFVESMPKVIPVKHSHHFGAWTKNLVIGLVALFLITTGSLAAALYLNHRNDQLSGQAYRYQLIQALYPNEALAIEKGIKENPEGIEEKARKALARQQAISVAESEAAEAEKAKRQANEKLKKLKAGGR